MIETKLIRVLSRAEAYMQVSYTTGAQVLVQEARDLALDHTVFKLVKLESLISFQWPEARGKRPDETEGEYYEYLHGLDHAIEDGYLAAIRAALDMLEHRVAQKLIDRNKEIEALKKVLRRRDAQYYGGLVEAARQ